jgi:hypothetical protein
MRSKTFAIAVSLTVLSVCAGPVEALTIQFTAENCASCWQGNMGDVAIDALMTVESATGMYWHPVYSVWFSGTYLAVSDITGFIDGVPMTFAQAPNGSPSWLYPGYLPGLVYFAAGGIDYRIIYDLAYVLLQAPTLGTQTPITGGAVVVPDQPSSLMLLAFSLIALTLFKCRETRWKRNCG